MTTTAELIATAVMGALGGGILTVLGQETLRYWRRPILTVYFEDKGEYIAQTPINWPRSFNDPDAGTDELQAIYVRVKVINSGLATARSCRAYITHVERENFDGSADRIERQDSIPIPWSLRGAQGIEPFDLPRGINQFADICFTVSRDEPQKLFNAAPMFPLRFRRSWDRPGRFELEIMVTADGAKPASQMVKFEWQGPWNSIRHLS